MRSVTKRQVSLDQLDALLRSAWGVGCSAADELTDGWFNAAYRVVLADGRPAIVKLAPPPDVPVLRYEQDMMATEAMVYRRVAELSNVPQPELLHAGDDLIVLSVLDGTPWDKVQHELSAQATSQLRRELGRITARLHTLRSADDRFGYPAPRAAIQGPTWRAAFVAMVEAILSDAARWDAPLGVLPDEVRVLVAAGASVLDEVTVPVLVHFDLWPGNVFVSIGGDDFRVTGLIDHERAIWADPAAELVSLEFGGDIGPDSDLVAGYREAGGELGSAVSLPHRLALYRVYLGLLLVVECGPRGYGADRVAFCQGLLDRWLTALREFA